MATSSTHPIFNRLIIIDLYAIIMVTIRQLCPYLHFHY